MTRRRYENCFGGEAGSSMQGNKIQRINMISGYLKEHFGEKVVKLALDGGFTCPNRDGSKGVGGCIFCSADGSGEFAGSIPSQIALLSKKWPRAKYIAYFQNHTNTYAPVSELREKFTAALNYKFESGTEYPEIVGLAIATRPDCLNDEIYEFLYELSQKTFLWVELGLQSIHEQTGSTINRCHSLDVYDNAVNRLAALGIRTVTHLIFGLPKKINADGSVIPETREEMLASVRHICRALPAAETAPRPDYALSASVSEASLSSNSLNASQSLCGRHIFGIKLHMLNIVRGSQMEYLCPDYIPFSNIDEYTDLVVDALKIIPRDITVHRMSADAPRSILIAPEWSYKKRTILNSIHRKMAERNIDQGQDAE